MLISNSEQDCAPLGNLICWLVWSHVRPEKQFKVMLKPMCTEKGSQCEVAKTGVMCSLSFVLVSTLAEAFSTSCALSIVFF